MIMKYFAANGLHRPTGLNEILGMRCRIIKSTGSDGRYEKLRESQQLPWT